MKIIRWLCISVSLVITSVAHADVNSALAGYQECVVNALVNERGKEAKLKMKSAFKVCKDTEDALIKQLPKKDRNAARASLKEMVKNYDYVLTRKEQIAERKSQLKKDT